MREREGEEGEGFEIDFLENVITIPVSSLPPSGVSPPPTNTAVGSVVSYVITVHHPHR